jgi:uncharacterized coiled-coil protein SlyX
MEAAMSSGRDEGMAEVARLAARVVRLEEEVVFMQRAVEEISGEYAALQERVMALSRKVAAMEGATRSGEEEEGAGGAT